MPSWCFSWYLLGALLEFLLGAILGFFLEIFLCALLGTLLEAFVVPFLGPSSSTKMDQERVLVQVNLISFDIMF